MTRWLRVKQERKLILQKKEELVQSGDHYLLPRGQSVYWIVPREAVIRVESKGRWRHRLSP